MLNKVIALLILTSTLLFGATTHSDAKERRVAFIISNAKYEHGPVLINPPVDTAAIAATLKDLAFDDIEIVRDATADVLRKRLRDFALKSRLADVSVIYYAGHGLEADGQNYFVPVDAHLESDIDIAFEAVGIDLAIRAVSGAKKLKLLILDACRDNPVAKSGVTDGKSRSFGTGLAPIETSGDVLVSYAAAAGQVAQDGPDGGNSPFAKALTEHLRAPGVDVRQVLGRVRDSVLAATDQKQRPFVYASLGGDPIYLVPPPDAPPPKPSPIVVDFTLADPEEDAVQAMLSDASDQFKFAYDLKTTTTPKATKMIPRLDYFVSASERGRPLIKSLEYGFFSPGDDAPWSLSYPLLDIIARRNAPQVITLSELVVEVEQSVQDNAPYLGLASPSDQFAKLVLFNEGWSDVKRATLEYDVVGLAEPTRKRIEEITKAKRDGGYAHKSVVGPFQDFAFFSLADGLAKAMPDFKMYQFAVRSSPYDILPDGRLKKKAAGAPAGFDAWLKANPAVSIVDQQGKGVWIIGRMIVESARDGVEPVIADFVAPIPIYAPDGLGAGQISYNLKDRIVIRSEGIRYAARKNIGYLLDADTKTFRGLFPLIVDQSSRHRMRVVVKGDGGADLYVSDWIDAHIVVPRFSKKAVDRATLKGPDRPRFKGIGLPK